MAVVLNSCARCGREISQHEVGYFNLNERTDRFDLECRVCYKFEKLGQNEIV